MGRRLRLDEVRGFEYLEVDLQDANQTTRGYSANYFGLLTPVEPCARCGRLAEDLTRTDQGTPVEENVLEHETFGHEPLCDSCIEADRDAEIVAILESKLGLSEQDRDALRSFIETVFTDPAKILQVKDLDNRVRDLEKQNTRLWTALGIAFGLVAISIAGVVAIALALAA